MSLNLWPSISTYILSPRQYHHHHPPPSPPVVVDSPTISHAPPHRLSKLRLALLLSIESQIPYLKSSLIAEASINGTRASTGGDEGGSRWEGRPGEGRSARDLAEADHLVLEGGEYNMKGLCSLSVSVSIYLFSLLFLPLLFIVVDVDVDISFSSPCCRQSICPDSV